MAVTQRDVAARAGVSPIVVSRVLHNRASNVRVSAATAERVRKAAEELDYRCNVSARNFRTQRTQTIGVLHGLGFPRPLFDAGSRYFAALMDGIVEGAFEHDYAITLCPKLLGKSPIDAISDGRFDGLVWYSTMPSEEWHEILSRSSVPLVAIHETPGGVQERWPTVICDNDQGIRLAVEHLRDHGHERIAFALEGHALNLESQLRLEAFRRHMSLLGLSVSDEDVLDIGWQKEELERYYSRPLRHTAIIAHNDGLAAAFLEFAPRFGVSIPGQLSIVGFDSTSYCNELQPRLTSVSQPLRQIGRTALHLLASFIAGEPGSRRGEVLPCGLDVRKSTGPAPR